jgi:hypothetical protein
MSLTAPCRALSAEPTAHLRDVLGRHQGGLPILQQPQRRRAVRGAHEVEVRDDRGRVSTTGVDLRFRRMTVHPPIGKQRRYPSLSLTAIHADERGAARGL